MSKGREDVRTPQNELRVCTKDFFFQAEDGIRDIGVTGVQTCALPICAIPRTSVTKPGVSSRAPPTRTSAPSMTSRAGGRPARNAWVKRCHVFRPCARSSSEPRIESATRISTVGPTPISWPTWMITASSAIGTTMNSRTRNGSTTGQPTPSPTLGAMVDPDAVTEALTNVIDPELGLDFVELGLIYGVNIDGGKVDVTFTLTTPACPIGPQVSEQRSEERRV